MCDYSLYTANTRLAEESEDLVLHRFDSGSLGFCSAREFEQEQRRSEFARGCSSLMQWMFPSSKCGPTAVCIPPAARLHITGVPSRAESRWHDLDGQSVYFTQLSVRAYAHRDALLLPNGQPVILQKLPPGLRARVLALAPEETSTIETVAVKA